MLMFGVDQRMVEAPYIGRVVRWAKSALPLRMLVPCVVGLALTLGLSLFLCRPSTGARSRAVAQDSLGAAADGRRSGARSRPWRSASPSPPRAGRRAADHHRAGRAPIGRPYIGRAFCITVLAGLGSMPARWRPGMILGVAESLVPTSFGPRGRSPWRSASCCWCWPSAPRACSGADGDAGSRLLRRCGRAARRRLRRHPRRGQRYFFFAGYVVLQFVVLATAWNILGGYAGYVNFGSGAFFALGAYTSVAPDPGLPARRCSCRSCAAGARSRGCSGFGDRRA